MADLILILGDQLALDISSLQPSRKHEDVVLMAEVREEAQYVRHHPKKIALIFSAMRHFAEELRKAGWRVEYCSFEDEGNTGSLTGEARRAIWRHRPARLRVTEPGEWRVLSAIQAWGSEFKLPVDIVPDTRFFCTREAFVEWASGRASLRMEYFYRDMRLRSGLLMDAGRPAGGRWNFDAENRKPAKAHLFMPAPLRFEPDSVTAEVLALVARNFGTHLGALLPFQFAATRVDAERAFEHFVQSALPTFGDFQDAMLTGEPFLYHAAVSMYLNLGLLDARSICARVEEEYRNGRVPINSAEGFIRQIIGWREYVRGIYWLRMPDYATVNHFNFQRRLPELYWTGRTDMACLHECVMQTIDQAYAHHIQRLMITGNFALLAGVTPSEVHEWYLSVYADAYEWVEMPNTLGLSQFADGGLMASKPYIASGAYINRMSDYCTRCRYNVKLRTEENACPFNALYWNFLGTQRDLLQRNTRLRTAFRAYDAMSEVERAAIAARAQQILDAL